MNKRKITTIVRYQIVVITLLLLLCVGVVWNINSGSVEITPGEVFKIIWNGIKDQIIYGQIQDTGMESSVIWKIRMPRMVMAAVLGGALAVSGYLLQTFFRNPIAGPFVLGISSGAKMCVALVLIFIIGSYTGMPSYLLVLSAFAGSLLIMGCVLLFSQKAQNMSMLLVIGIMIGYICSAVTDFCIAFAKDSEIASLTSWSMGSFSGAAWSALKLICPLVFLTLICTMLISKPMEAYLLGEGYAKSMGINIRFFRIVLIVLSSLLSACVTAFAGPISFVGIAVPQIAKRLMNTAKPLVIIPISFLCGAVFCMFCDLIARTAFSPTELSIGTVTAVFGAPVVIRLMIKRRGRQ